ncbi:hypothetical protein GCM10020001_092870 [Nonomuraea salmonea]
MAPTHPPPSPLPASPPLSRSTSTAPAPMSFVAPLIPVRYGRVRRVLAGCVLVGVVAGCGAAEEPPAAAAPASTPATTAPTSAAPTSAAPTSAAEASATPSASPTPSPSPSPTKKRKATSRVRDCFDGDCLLRVSRPVTIRLNAKKFYYRQFHILDVGKSSITYLVEYPHGGGAQATLGKGGTSSFGFRKRPTVEVSLVSVKKGRALVSITAGKPG